MVTFLVVLQGTGLYFLEGPVAFDPSRRYLLILDYVGRADCYEMRYSVLYRELLS